ncbi:uncharacterized protein NESG_01300 [Nematocida ausubeli]|uniref:Uncharacterized protein n=1 Tax=Nematocida ausubeli (strain ATCC PRA-371 / ERTm2) TaxID=1913371 RepID=A0A086J216_NEMA1|nr:uncharacterized protein NESG_01300 [Nematocida ausubeli]KAI5148485.1 hypothetical protein NEAUS05_1409 [Nematocida ausubeli]KFG26184.1 hypothetical protein NESG_01300 [Nematocida ausubeli]
MYTNIKALHTLLERNEIDKTSLTAEDIKYLKDTLNILGYNLNNWYDRKTLVLTAQVTEGPIKDYELIVLDILVGLFEKEQGTHQEDMKNCTVARNLVKSNWLVIDTNGYIQPSKRILFENTEILSEKTGIDICSICGILNMKGNIPHKECNPTEY